MPPVTRFFSLVLALFLVSSLTLYSQDQTGFRRPSVKYQQINTDSFRIIFPYGLEKTAQEVANTIHTVGQTRPFTTGGNLRKIDVLLQNATDIPNGYVGLGPWRSEFYLTPPQNSFDIGSLPWHQTLALHEYRHVQQTSAARKGITKLAHILFGQEAYSAAYHLAVPDWFIEGDAVVTETAMSGQGRGRIPAFFNGYKEKVRDGDYWSYMKVRNGSFKEYVPTEYPLGYLLVNHGRTEFGQGIWDSVMVDGAAYKGLFYAFSKNLKERTGLKTQELYADAMNGYRDLWKVDQYMYGDYLIWENDDRYRNFSYPAFGDSNQLFVMMEGFDQIGAIYAVRDGEYQRITSVGFQTEPYFDVSGSKLCWTELRRHPRWWREDYSVIMTCDIAGKRKHQVTNRSSYFMPSLSEDASRIVAVADSDFQQFSLHILSAESGSVIQQLPNPENVFYTYPQWSGDGRTIISAVRLTDGRMQLISQRIDDGSIRELTLPSFSPIGRPEIAGEYIYYSMSSGFSDQIYRLHHSTGFVERITGEGRSAYQPAVSPDTRELVFAEFTLHGKKLKFLPTDSMTVYPERVERVTLPASTVLPGEYNMLQVSDSVSFDVSTYPLLTRPVRLHSWNLAADDPEYRVELLSENTLNTLQIQAGYKYNRNNDFHGPFAELTFGLWYPEIIVGYSSTHVRRTIEDETFRYWQHSVNAGFRIPFYAYSGPYSQAGSISTRINRIFTSGDGSDFTFDYLSHTLYFSNARKRAYQHAESRFSQTVAIRSSHSIDTLSGDQFHVETDFTLPSPVRNQFFWLEFDYRSEPSTNDIQFNDLFDYARGYDPVDGENVWRAGISYQLPVAYPDFGFAGLLYVRRVRIAPFFDFMRVDDMNYRSTGAELYLDLNVFNVQSLTVGGRWAKRLDLDKGWDFEFILPVLF